jgi:hypothetical protein
MKFIRVFLLVLIIIGIAALATMKLWVPKLVDKILSSEEAPVIAENPIIGCYVAHLAKDVYALQISSVQDESISGQLDINNAEKDSSTGTLKGTYKDGILLADYTFQSEGTESVNQVIFKKLADGFVRGYGKPDDATGTRFVDLSKINYDMSAVYNKVPEGECPISTPVIQSNVTLVDGRQCYMYSHDGTPLAPYSVIEFLDITIAGTNVTGTKNGVQDGPDLTNGYEGTIKGILEKNSITDVFSYVVEGAPNKEKEIYRASKTGLEKLRYPLVDEKGILVPDLTKTFEPLLYARVDCEGSN